MSDGDGPLKTILVVMLFAGPFARPARVVLYGVLWAREKLSPSPGVLGGKERADG